MIMRQGPGHICLKGIVLFFCHHMKMMWLYDADSRCLYDVMGGPRLTFVGKKIKDRFLIICADIPDKNHIVKTDEQRWAMTRFL